MSTVEHLSLQPSAPSLDRSIIATPLDRFNTVFSATVLQRVRRGAVRCGYICCNLYLISAANLTVNHLKLTLLECLAPSLVFICEGPID